MSSRIQDLISENKNSRSTTLKLGGIDQIPPEISELHWLESLSLKPGAYASSKLLSDLGPLAGLKSLQVLDISHTGWDGTAS